MAQELAEGAVTVLFPDVEGCTDLTESGGEFTFGEGREVEVKRLAGRHGGVRGGVVETPGRRR